MSTKHEGFTPGPWFWSNSGGEHPTLYASRRLVVMDFVRMGMDGAQPRFSDRNGEPRGGLMHKWGKRDFNEHPDARMIADAPRLYAENQRLRDAIARVAAALDADGRTTDGCTKADAVARLRAALTEPDA